MGLRLFLFLVGVVAVFGDGVQIEDTLEDSKILTLDSEGEIPEQFSVRAGCHTTRACRKRKGSCIDSSETCNGREERGCKGNCTCCVTESERCDAKSSCNEAKGFCMQNSGSCPGYTIEGGCTGSDCICCVNDVQYYFWIGGRGVGESFMYISGQSLPDDAPWGQYGGTSLEDCLAIGSTSSLYNTTLASFDCNNKYYFICEPACPDGFLRVESACYKVVTHSQRWDDAEVNCYEEGLTLAEPEDPKRLAEILYNGVGGASYRSNYWLGARGGRINGSIIAWNSGDAVPVPYPNNSTWRSGNPRYFTSSYCLSLYTYYYNRGPGPLSESGCTSSLGSICEMICPLGFFHIGNRCYKAYSTGASSWGEAHKMCEQAHLTLAQPEDPITLANFLFVATGHHNYWLGGRGDGSMFLWSSGEPIPSNWSAWQPGNPGSKVGSDYCLRLVPEYRTTPLTSSACSTTLYPLCQ